MKCKYCFQDLIEHEPFFYCNRCNIWYEVKGKELEDGVYYYCDTKDNEPEKCNQVIQDLIIKSHENKDGEDIPIANTGITQVKKADEICASCSSKNFVHY